MSINFWDECDILNLTEIETGDKVNVFIMKVKDYYCLLIRKKSREPIVIYFWNSFLYLDNDFVRKDFFSFNLKQFRNDKVNNSISRWFTGLLPQKKIYINGKL